MKLFDNIDKNYDLLNHLFSLGMDIRWRQRMIDELLSSHIQKIDGLILDLATGTGDSAYEGLKRGLTVIGVDTSLKMMSFARHKYCFTYPSTYTLASASGYALPFKNNVFSGAICAFGIRNMTETSVVLRELYRVLKDNASLVILEFTPPRGYLSPLYRFYLHKIMPFVANFFSDKSAYKYLADSIESFHSPEKLKKLILQAGFKDCNIIKLCFGNVLIHKATKDPVSIVGAKVY